MDPVLQAYRREHARLKRCEKCAQVQYCSDKCAKKDWMAGHQFKCSGVSFDVPDEEKETIASDTPFLKEGQLLKDEDISSRKLCLEDFEFVGGKSSKKVLGKGSYGQVQLVKHKKTGRQFALKTINKTSIAN